MKQRETNYRLPIGYQPNLQPNYYTDNHSDKDIVWQPDVYKLAYFVAKEGRIRHIIDIGSGNGQKLEVFLKNDFVVHACDFGDNLKIIKEKFSSYKNLNLYEINLENNLPKFPDDVYQNAVVIASDVIEHIQNPERFLKWFQFINQKIKFIFVSTPDRDRNRGYGSLSSPANRAHVREWNLNEFLLLLEDYGIRNTIHGFTKRNNVFPDKSTILTLFGLHIPSLSTIQNIKPLQSFCCRLHISIYDLAHLQTHLLFWEKQSLSIDYHMDDAIPEEKRQELIRRFPILSKTHHAQDVLFELPVSSRLYAPWGEKHKPIVLNQAFSYLLSLGYSTIYMKTKKTCYEHFLFEKDNLKQVALSENKGRKYPLPFILIELFDMPFEKVQFLPLDSYENYCNYIVEHICVENCETPFYQLLDYLCD